MLLILLSEQISFVKVCNRLLLLHYKLTVMTSEALVGQVVTIWPLSLNWRKLHRFQIYLTSNVVHICLFS
jgi:hypothetical protein